MTNAHGRWWLSGGRCLDKCVPPAFHKLETPLSPAARYFWTVRARFKLDGVTRVTPWARIHGSGSSEFVSPIATTSE